MNWFFLNKKNDWHWKLLAFWPIERWWEICNVYHLLKTVNSNYLKNSKTKSNWISIWNNIFKKSWCPHNLWILQFFMDKNLDLLFKELIKKYILRLEFSKYLEIRFVKFFIKLSSIYMNINKKFLKLGGYVSAVYM